MIFPVFSQSNFIAIDKSQMVQDLNFTKFAVSFPDEALIVSAALIAPTAQVKQGGTITAPATSQPSTQHEVKREEKKEEKRAVERKNQRDPEEKECCLIL